ncbi:hypothetical protein CYMTET_16650 [Cymbomonas tetramitiformis]|uniref:Uncharacterized protein n=1 Tax=Cymbomonas tetramitiformis TaxID=36881 RepID=A0AAE0L7X7_9CHLO|nr:hypothetical protein CYMTET_16650 [Cymbomonas tetramitiformis]
MASLSADPKPKVHKSALCLIPPSNLWGAIQHARCFNDKSYVRWPPHVNLLYPFWEDNDINGSDNFSEAAERAAHALRDVQPFQVSFENFGFFEHGKSATVWLHPDSQELLDLQATLTAAFPECKDLSNDPARGITAFKPHLSVGQWRNAAEASAAVEQLQATWKKSSFSVQHVALISREGFEAPFKVRYIIPVGSAAKAGAAPVQVDVPYVATVGAAIATSCGSGEGGALAESTGGDVSSLGLGGQFGGRVWNFAYGANMAKEKLSGARGLNPLESKCGVLQGYRLSFSHRGGMGNVVPCHGAADSGPGDLGEAVHGVLHLLTVEEMAQLTNMEHEYWPVEVEVQAYDGTLVTAVVFQSPPERLITEGLPPIERYLKLLQVGARDWGLEEGYCKWLEALPSIGDGERGDEYYTSAEGEQLRAWPKTRTGSNTGGGRRSGRSRNRRKS